LTPQHPDNPRISTHTGLLFLLFTPGPALSFESQTPKSASDLDSQQAGSLSRRAGDAAAERDGGDDGDKARRSSEEDEKEIETGGTTEDVDVLLQNYHATNPHEALRASYGGLELVAAAYARWGEEAARASLRQLLEHHPYHPRHDADSSISRGARESARTRLAREAMNPNETMKALGELVRGAMTFASREPCPVCAAEVNFARFPRQACPSGHALQRCMRCFGVVDPSLAACCAVCGGSVCNTTNRGLAGCSDCACGVKVLLRGF
jgi:hypothetical protein